MTGITIPEQMCHSRFRDTGTSTTIAAEQERLAKNLPET